MFGKVGPLDGSDGAEGPAWAASALVFDNIETSLYPVDIVGEIAIVEGFGVSFLILSIPATKLRWSVT